MTSEPAGMRTASAYLPIWAATPVLMGSNGLLISPFRRGSVSQSHPAGAILPIRFAELVFQDLAARIAGQRVHEIDRSRTFVTGQMPAAELDDLGGFHCGPGNHDRFDRFAPLLVGHTDDRGIGDSGM